MHNAKQMRSWYLLGSSPCPLLRSGLSRLQPESDGELDSWDLTAGKSCLGLQHAIPEQKGDIIMHGCRMR